MVNQEYSYFSDSNTSKVRSKTSNIFSQHKKVSKPKSKMGDFTLEIPDSYIDAKAKEIKYALKKGGEINISHLKNVLKKHLIQKYEEITETNRIFKKRTEAVIEEGISHFSFYLDDVKTEYITKTGLFNDPIFNDFNFYALFPSSQKSQTNGLIQLIMSKGKLKKTHQRPGIKKAGNYDDAGRDIVREFDLTGYRKKA